MSAAGLVLTQDCFLASCSAKCSIAPLHCASWASQSWALPASYACHAFLYCKASSLVVSSWDPIEAAAYRMKEVFVC